MMKNKNLILFLLLAPLVTMMCEYSSPDFKPYAQQPGVTCGASKIVKFTDASGLIMQDVCVFTCPSNSEISVKLPSDQNRYSTEELERIYCEEELVEEAAVATATNTAVPATATPTPRSGSVQEAGPLLTSEVTFCDMKNRIINLRIVEGSSLTFTSLETTIGGLAVTCAVNASNATLYSCSLPEKLVFPAQIVVTGDGVRLNGFPLESSDCVVPQKPPEDDPAPTPGPVDCITNPSAPGC